MSEHGLNYHLRHLHGFHCNRQPMITGNKVNQRMGYSDGLFEDELLVECNIRGQPGSGKMSE